MIVLRNEIGDSIGLSKENDNIVVTLVQDKEGVAIYQWRFSQQELSLDFLQAFKPTKFIIRDCDINIESIQSVCNILSKTPYVTGLSFLYNNIGTEVLQILFDFLKNTFITSLCISGSDLSFEQIKKLALFIEDSKTLTKLGICCDNLRFAGLQKLIPALQNNKTIVELNLRNNNLDYQSGKMLSLLVESNKIITKLDLSCNNLGFVGLQELIPALQNNKTIIELNLGNNNLGYQSGKILSLLVENNKTITKLDLSYNNLGFEVIDLLIKMNKFITEFNFNNNNVSVKETLILWETLARDTVINIINISEDPRNHPDENVPFAEIQKSFDVLEKKNKTLIYISFCNKEICSIIYGNVGSSKVLQLDFIKRNVKLAEKVDYAMDVVGYIYEAIKGEAKKEEILFKLKEKFCKEYWLSLVKFQQVLQEAPQVLRNKFKVYDLDNQDAEGAVNVVSNFITDNFLKIAAICKNLTCVGKNTSQINISDLNYDVLHKIFSYVGLEGVAYPRELYSSIQSHNKDEYTDIIGNVEQKDSVSSFDCFL